MLHHFMKFIRHRDYVTVISPYLSVSKVRHKYIKQLLLHIIYIFNDTPNKLYTAFSVFI